MVLRCAGILKLGCKSLRHGVKPDNSLTKATTFINDAALLSHVIVNDLNN